MKSYKTILKNEEIETVVNKSRFVGHCARVLNEEEAIGFIQDIKNSHRDATHNVFAYVIGLDNEIQRYSDDGEPNGTVGIPIINFLKNMELTNIAVVVTRYFGGIKLGTGGLARAYAGAARDAVEKGKIVEAKQFSRIRLGFDYSLIGKIENTLSQKKTLITEKVFDEKVAFVILAEKDEVTELLENLVNLTANQIAATELESQYYLKDGSNIYDI